jgi:hypothetical protein
MEHLQRLAASATQAPLQGEARPALRPRFGPQPAAAFDTIGEVPTAPTQRQLAPQPQAQKPLINPAPRERAPKTGASDRQASAAAATPHDVATRDPMPAGSTERVLATAHRPLAERTHSNDMDLHRARPLAMVSSHDDAAPVGAATSTAAGAMQAPRTAPLREAVVASRMMASHPSAPVVHVTIDRIEVRAAKESPAKRSSPQPARAEPKQSLSGYLRGESARGTGG